MKKKTKKTKLLQHNCYNKKKLSSNLIISQQPGQSLIIHVTQTIDQNIGFTLFKDQWRNLNISQVCPFAKVIYKP